MTAKNTHRRQVRTVTPAVRAGRAAAGAAMAAGILFGGAAAATAEGNTEADAGAVQADAPVAAPAVIQPVTEKAVEIPTAAGAEDAEATPLSAFEAKGISVEVPEPEPVVEEEPASEEGQDGSSDSSDSDQNSSSSNDSSDDNSSSRGSSSDEDAESSSSSSSDSSSDDKKSSSKAPSAAKGGSILSTARSGIGTPYVYGGASPSGWDCSGFVQWVYGQHGVDMPHSAGAQAAMGTQISRSEAQPGDLVYKPGHIGIYAGNGQFVDAGNSRVDTTERNIYSGDWSFYRVG